MKDVYTSYGALKTAVHDFRMLDDKIPLNQRTSGQGYADNEARLNTANTVVERKVRDLWNKLINLPPNIKSALTNRDVIDAPGGWNEEGFLTTNPFGIRQLGGTWSSEKYEHGKNISYFVDPEKKTSLFGKTKNPLYSAIAYLQQIEHRAKSIAVDDRDNTIPPVSTVMESLCSMVFDYILKAKESPPRTEQRNWL